ncbi:MAG: glycosyltransferase [Bacteroidales bacterium]|nr:glycosyltransferase [Bacteroidales bacterium]
MQNLRISVITVCLNASKTIEQTILSIINQTYDNIEYIIIDGVSTDGTLDIIKKYESKISLCQSEPDNGIYDAMNKGLKLATGDFLIFMGADDVFYNENVIYKVASEIDNYDDIYYGSVIFKGTNTIHWGKFSRLKWASANVCHQAVFYPKVVYKQYNYDTSYVVCADYIYNLNLIKCAYQFKFINEIVTLFDITGYSSYALDEKFQKDFAGIMVKTVGVIPYIGGIFVRKIVFPIFDLIAKIRNRCQ